MSDGLKSGRVSVVGRDAALTFLANMCVVDTPRVLRVMESINPQVFANNLSPPDFVEERSRLSA
jgi:hypothetical protein